MVVSKVGVYCTPALALADGAPFVPESPSIGVHCTRSTVWNVFAGLARGIESRISFRRDENSVGGFFGVYSGEIRFPMENIPSCLPGGSRYQ